MMIIIFVKIIIHTIEVSYFCDGINDDNNFNQIKAIIVLLNYQISKVTIH